MPDLTDVVLPQIKQKTLPSIPATGEFILPAYENFSLSNIPASICKLLNVPEFGDQALDSVIIDKLNMPVKKIVFLLVDALGFSLLNKWMHEKNDYWYKNLTNSIFTPLTSISPSTTATALTTLWTGESPASHGIIGYEMWAKEFGMVINNILHSPVSFANDMGGLSRAGFEPDRFLDRQTLGNHLKKHGVKASSFMHYSIGNSGLSSMHMDDVDLHGYYSESDLWITLRNILNNSPDQPRYMYVYWSLVDTLSHRFSYNDPRVELQFEYFTTMMEEILLSGLTSASRKDTLLILTADHGSICTPINSQYELAKHPELKAMLRIQPTCENRLAFLYIKPGKKQAVENYFHEKWPGKFYLIDGTQAIKEGLFGLNYISPNVEDRVGDIIAIAREDAYIWWAEKPNTMLGRHGGLHPEEMLVPFYAIPL